MWIVEYKYVDYLNEYLIFIYFVRRQNMYLIVRYEKWIKDQKNGNVKIV